MASKPTNQKKNASHASKASAAQKKQMQNRRELTGVICIVLALFALLCYVNTDAFLISTCAALIGGLIGQVGRYLLPFILIYVAVILFKSGTKPVKMRIFTALTLILTLSAAVHIICEIFSGTDVPLKISALYQGGKNWTSGGLFPGLLAELLEAALMKVGALIALLLLLVLQILACMRITVASLIAAIKNRPRIPGKESPEEEPEEDPAERLVNRVANKRIERYEKRHAAPEIDIPVDDPPLAPQKKEKKRTSRVMSPDEYLLQKQTQEEPTIIDAAAKQVTIDEIELHDPEPELVKKPAPAVPVTPVTVTPPAPKPEQEKLKKGEAEASAAEISQEIEKATESAPAAQEYVYPPISLLTLRKQGMVDATAEMRENTTRLADTLKSFGIEPHIVNVIRGPSVTRYELELDRGVKLSKLTNLADDIALSLGATGVRISAIPDKISVVGIEVPNKTVNTVYAREVIDSPVFKNSKSKISFAVGKDISGNCIVGDIAKLPHMLIAGTTGSGKSVCMNTLILSLLYKAKPDEVKLIMVDPKMVELGVYNGIPHLLIPVVTDPKKAAGALQWTVTEMMRRYRLMSEEGVRDLESYNKAIYNDPDQEPMPQIVVVIDELADLMLVAAKEVEESICRIAQMGRASGIHLVIATQRPSADVITGLMKANIPSRIAFAVSSSMESRIILDTQGAEKLVGKGDMLFAPLGQGKPKRVQGCFISDEEVQAVVSAIKSQAASDYSEEIMEQIEKRAEQSGKGGASADVGRASADSDGDELLPAAVEVILETGQASVSMLQRRLKLGYARAARIVDEMEERGIVGPFEGAKPRQLLITREQWQQMQDGTYEPNPPVEEEIP
ncbi:MAG: DNA translocase FtsK [Firmicutes bacterium]|nr:DNA translocase FtsK [Bacillota bacterium]